MKKSIVVLGLGFVLACGTLFAMNYPSKINNIKTELNENTVEEICDECWEKEEGHDALGHTQIKIHNNCPYRVTVTYKYWTDRWVPVKFDVNEGATSQWHPANSYKDFNCKMSK